MFSRLLEALLIVLFGLLRLLPLEWAARIGRCVGGLAVVFARRHRRIAEENLRMAFPDWPESRVRETAAENLRRIGEAYACAIRVPGMSLADLGDRLRFTGFEEALPPKGVNLLAATGHFGNFDLLSQAQQLAPDRRMATTYRAQKLRALENALQRLRRMTGVEFVERRQGVAPLKRLFESQNAIVALFSDQHGGGHGLWIPLFGHPCSCSPAAAVMALRYRARLAMAYCFRIGLARWEIQCGPVIATQEADGSDRSVEAITRDVMAAYETAIRRDPANWFWVHRRWKPPSAIQTRRESKEAE